MMIPTFETLSLVVKQNSIWTLTLERPQVLNALSSQVLQDLEKALAFLRERPFAEARGLILTGRGEKAFVAGADIKELSGLNADAALSFARLGQKVFRLFETLPIPVVAAVNGFALGGGLELALACDFIMASDNAKLGLPEVSLGLLPGFGGCVRLARNIGTAQARRLIFSGEAVTAQQAFDLGLVSKVTPADELLAAAESYLQSVVVRAPLAVAAVKRTVLAAWDTDVDAALELEANAFASLFRSKDFQEGTQAFLEKRKPTFSGQ